MSSDKRRRARVQGGWAPPTNSRSDRDKPKAPSIPNWYGKTVDQPSSSKKFVYEQPKEVGNPEIGILDVKTMPNHTPIT